MPKEATHWILAEHAWQAMPGGGEIYLETENVFLDDEQAFPYAVKPGRYVKITVTDTGTGMDEKTKERIFDPSAPHSILFTIHRINSRRALISSR